MEQILKNRIIFAPFFDHFKGENSEIFEMTLFIFPLVFPVFPDLCGVRFENGYLSKYVLYFLTISYLFSIPINSSYLKFHCSFEVLHLEKLEKWYSVTIIVLTYCEKKLF